MNRRGRPCGSIPCSSTRRAPARARCVDIPRYLGASRAAISSASSHRCSSSFSRLPPGASMRAGSWFMPPAPCYAPKTLRSSRRSCHRRRVQGFRSPPSPTRRCCISPVSRTPSLAFDRWLVKTGSCRAFHAPGRPTAISALAWYAAPSECERVLGARRPCAGNPRNRMTSVLPASSSPRCWTRRPSYRCCKSRRPRI